MKSFFTSAQAKRALGLLISLIIITGAYFALYTLIVESFHGPCLSAHVNGCYSISQAALLGFILPLPVALAASYRAFKAAGIERPHIPVIIAHFIFAQAVYLNDLAYPLAGEHHPDLGYTRPLLYLASLCLTALVWTYRSNIRISTRTRKYMVQAAALLPLVLIIITLNIVASTFRPQDVMPAHQTLLAPGNGTGECDDRTICVDVTLVEADIASRKMSGTTSVERMSADVARSIYTASGESILTPEGALKPQYAGLTLTLTGAEANTTGPLKSLCCAFGDANQGKFNWSTLEQWNGKYESILQGDGRTFPSDTYVQAPYFWGYNVRYSITPFTMLLPDGFYSTLSTSGKSIPISIQIKMGINAQTDNGLRISASSGGDQIAISVQRDIQTQAFIYIIALSPLLIVITLIFMLVRNDRRLDQLFLVQVSAGLLSILPLRQVLVSSDIHTLTRIDYILGTELLIILAITMIKFARDATRQV